MVDFSHPLGGGSLLVSSRSPSHTHSDHAKLSEATVDRADCSRRQVAILFVLIAAVSCLPIVLHPLPPLTDYVNHLARMHVIATIGSDPDLAQFYQVDWQVVPNLMMDLIVPLMQRIANVYVAGQIYTVASFVLILSGALALNRALFGRWSMLPLIAAPLLYNQVFLVGTMNYVSAIGLALWSLAAWVWLRERGMVLRLSVSACFVVALFFCHLYAVGVYGIGLLAYELYRLLELYQREPFSRRSRRDVGGRLFDFVACGVPFLPVLLLIMMSPTWGLRGGYSWELEGKLDGILYVIQLYFPTAALLMIGLVAIAIGGAIYCRALRFHAFGWILLAVGAIVYAAMPRIIFDTYMADQRLPISIAFMVIACGQLNVRNAYVRPAFAVVLVALVALRVGEVQVEWNDAARTSTAFRQSMDSIERGSRILVAYGDADAGDGPRDRGLVHAACQAIIERSSLVTTAFTVLGKQILHARPDYRDSVDTEDGTPPSVQQLLELIEHPETETDAYWGNWTLDYDYLYVVFTRPGQENPNPRRLSERFVGERFALYRIVPPEPEAEPVDPPATREPPTTGAVAQIERGDVRHTAGMQRVRPRRVN
jgi:hypothetical protein